MGRTKVNAIALFLAGNAAFGQITTTYAYGAMDVPLSQLQSSFQQTSAEPKATIRVFLDCLPCDEDFLRTEVTFIDFVRDRRDADVHVLVTTQASGAGTEYTLAFIGLAGFADTNVTVRYASSRTDTTDEVRHAIARRLAFGLTPYLARTTPPDQVDIPRSPVTAQPPSAMTQPEDDPWRAWLFRASADANLNTEQSRQFLSVSGAFSAERTTETWKVRLNARGVSRKEEFDLGNSETFTNTTHDWNTTMLVVRSVGNHWGVGIGGSVVSSTFVNQARASRLAPAVEFNVFPYADSTRRQLTVTYAIGTNSFKYEEPTIFDRMSDVLADQTLMVSLNMNQPWGRTSVSVEGAQFVADSDKFRVVTSGELEFRILRGLSLEVIGSTSLIRDQVFLARRESSPEEVLVRRRQLATDYAHSLFLGISYTFGSIFNNVVNARFAGSSGGVIRRF